MSSGLMPLHAAVRGKNYAKVQALFDAPNAHNIIVDAPDMLGHTPLMWAAHFGDVESAKILIDHGATVQFDVRRGPGISPLHEAARSGSVETCRLLLNHGACAAADANEHPLNWALTVDVARLLIDAGGAVPFTDANFKESSTRPITPLHFAASSNRVELKA